MKLKKLNLQMGGVIIATALIMIACNNSDESAKDSTKNDSATVNPTTDTTTTTKRRGRASTVASNESNKGSKIEKDKMGYYTFTEVAPIYPGGQSALESYINNNIEYPEDAINNNVEGTVNVQFVIDESGTVSNVQATGAKLGYGLEEEAVKIISQMPKWTPGQVKGKSVKARYSLPITYKLES